MRGLACVQCAKFLRMKKQGVVLEEGMPQPGGTWGPYKLWMVDLYECPTCGFQVTAGAGYQPFAEHYQASYAAQRDKHPPLITVNDCGGAKP